MLTINLSDRASNLIDLCNLFVSKDAVSVYLKIFLLRMCMCAEKSCTIYSLLILNVL